MNYKDRSVVEKKQKIEYEFPPYINSQIEIDFPDKTHDYISLDSYV